MLNMLKPRESDARKALLKMLPHAAVSAEIGVWKGDFSDQILKVAKPQTLHLIDPWLVSDAADRSSEAWYGADKITQAQMDAIHDSVAARFSHDMAAKRVVIHRSDAATALGAMAEASIDFVYIDGDHSYEGVTTDLGQAFRVTKAGGLICCDDYMLGTWWKDGVIRAVHEFVAARPVTIEMKQSSQIVMRKRSDV